MEPWQLQRIRDGLLAVKELGQSEGGHAYSWASIAEAIGDETGVEVPEDRLSKFVIGEPHRDPTKKSRGIRHYPVLPEQRMAAVIAFLTSQESTGYVFGREELDLRDVDFAGPLRLMEHLERDGKDQRYLKPALLAGLFTCSDDAHGRAREDTLMLRFRDKGHDGPVRFSLYRARRTEDTIAAQQPATDPDDGCGAAMNHYRGWAVLSPEENILLFAAHERNGANRFLLSLGIDGGLYDGAPLRGLVLLDHDYPEDGTALESAADLAALQSAVLESLAERVLVFRRQEDRP